MSEDVDSGDHIRLIRSNLSNSEPDLEAPGSKKSGITGLLKQLDRRLSGWRPSRSHHDGGLEPFDRPPPADALGDGAPPEWALLLIGSLLEYHGGISLRFPRLLRVKEDKAPDQDTTSEQVAEIYCAIKFNHPNNQEDEDDD